MKRTLVLFLLIISSFWAKSQLSYINHYNYNAGEYFADFDEDRNLYMISKLEKGTIDYLPVFLLTKFNKSGNVVWRKKYVVGREPTYYRIYYIKGKLAIAGTDLFGGFVLLISKAGVMEKGTSFFVPPGTTATQISSINSDDQNNFHFTLSFKNNSSNSARIYSELVTTDADLNIKYSFSDPIHKLSTDVNIVAGINQVISEKMIIRYDSLGREYGYSYGLIDQDIESIAKLRSTNAGGLMVARMTMGFKLFLVDGEGKPIDQSFMYPETAYTASFDDEENIYMLCRAGNSPNYIQRLYVFNPALELINSLEIKSDSLINSLRLFPFCKNHFKINSQGYANQFRINEFDFIIGETGEEITITPFQASPTDIEIFGQPFFWTDPSGARTIQTMPYILSYGKDTTIIADTLYKYPDCKPLDFLSADTGICVITPFALSAPNIQPANVCGESIINYNWNNGADVPIITVTDYGLFKLTIDHAGCIYSDSILIHPDSISNDTTIEHCFEESTMILDPGVDNKGKWDNGTENSIQIDRGGQYNFSGINTNGCKIDLSYIINDRCNTMIYLPSSFTPDEDGYNEVFKPVGAALTTWTLTIYDRWGRQIWTGDENSNGWNGDGISNQLISGLYIFKLDYNLEDSMQVITGKVMLMR